MTHVEVLDLDRLPEHLIVLGGGYVGLELRQAMRRLGSSVTLIELGRQLASPEDGDFAQAIGSWGTHGHRSHCNAGRAALHNVERCCIRPPRDDRGLEGVVRWRVRK
jgi:pyruvate/2-oxoglutarate dehydrogenase complex dihydrolipoamide dehydrogenase (E3) component